MKYILRFTLFVSIVVSMGRSQQPLPPHVLGNERGEAGVNLRPKDDSKSAVNRAISPAIDCETPLANRSYGAHPYTPRYVSSPSSVSYVIVDSMTNILSMASSQISPLYYDPNIDRLIFVHRGDATSYAANSGEIYYNHSSDGGATWIRVPGIINGSDNPASGRYPSGAIFSPTSNVSDAWLFTSYSNLWGGGSFGDFGVGWDSTIFTNNVHDYYYEHNTVNNFSWAFETQCWPSLSNMFYMAVGRYSIYGNGGLIGLNIFRTSDFVSKPLWIAPYGLGYPNCFDIYKVLGGDFMKTGSVEKNAVAVIGDFTGTQMPALGLIYSTDEGTTWNGGEGGGWVDIVNLGTIPELCPYHSFWKFNSSYGFAGRMVLDSLGYPQCVVGLQADGQSSVGTDVVIAEIYRDATGWRGKIIGHADSKTHFMAGSIDQNGYAPYISRDKTGRYFAVQYTSSDNVNENADLFISTRSWIGWADWSAPVNITNTPNFNENLAHFSPRMRDDGNNLFTVWSAFAEPKDSSIIEDATTNRTYLLCGQYQVSIIPPTTPPPPPPPPPPPEPTWVWAKTATGGTYTDYVMSIALDTSGNSFVAGWFASPTLQFGASVLTNHGSLDMYVAKFDPTGNPLWANNAGGGSNDQANGIATDDSGNSYVTGSFTGPSITFGTWTLSNQASPDMYLVKYNPGGDVVWAKNSTGGNAIAYGEAVAVDDSGNCYATGQFYSPTIQFGPFSLINGGGYDMFIVKYDRNGNPVWAKKGGGSGSDYATGVAVDGSGNIYVTGYYYGPTIQFGATALTSAGFYDMYVVKYNPDGNVIWAKSATSGGTGADYASGVAADRAGNFCVAGYSTSSSLQFGLTSLLFRGGGDMFIVKFDPDGNAVWAKEPDCGNANSAATGVAIDAAGNSYVSGYYYAPAISFGPTVLTNSGGGGLFIAKFDPDGNVAWAKSNTDNFMSNGQASSVAVDPFGNSYLGGEYYTSSIQFDTSTLTNSGVYDIFLARLGTVQSETVAVSVNKDWNLVSLPVAPFNNSVSSLYPGSSGDAFAYTGTGYATNSTMATGVGYWLRYSSGTSVPIKGGDISYESLPVTAGWNLIGSVSAPLAVSAVGSVPGGITTSRFFGYKNGYFASDTIYPGGGYWVKVEQTGSLILSSSATTSPSQRIHVVPTQEIPPSPPDGVAGGSGDVPKEFALDQNYPNPFNPTTMISYQLPTASRVKLSLYNVLGQLVAVLVDGVESAGYKSVGFDAASLSSGVYYYKLAAGRFSRTMKMLVLK